MESISSVFIFILVVIGVPYGWRWGRAADSVDDPYVFVMVVTVVAFIWPLVGLLRLVRGKPFWVSSAELPRQA